MSVITLDTLSSGVNDIGVDSLGNIATKRDAEALANIVYNVDKTNLGECPLNTTLGTDYFGTIFNAHPDLNGFRTQNVEQTEQLEGVLSVQDFTTKISNDDGKLSLAYEKVIITEYGEIKTNG